MTVVVNSIVAFDATKKPWQNSIVALNSSKAILAYWDDIDNANYAIVFTVSGTTVTPGTRQSIAAGPGVMDGIEVAKLSETKAIVAYASNAADTPGDAAVLTISGTTITVGTPATFSSNEVTAIALAPLSSTKSICCWIDQDDGNKAKCCVLSVSGTTVTPGAILTINSASCANPCVEFVSSTKAVVTYFDIGAGSFPVANVLSVSGSTVTAGAKATIESIAANTSGNNRGKKRVSQIDATRLAAVWQRNSNGKIRASILTVSGTSISAGSVADVTTGAVSFDEYPAIAIDNTSRAVLIFDDGNTIGKILSLAISGTTITSNVDTEEFDTNTPFYETIAKLSSGKFICAYYRSNSGYVFIASLPSVGCRFYLGALAGALQEKFTLPFAGVAPKGMTLDRSLGTVVMVTDGANSDPVVYSTNPYVTGTVTDTNFPETAAGAVIKWI